MKEHTKSQIHYSMKINKRGDIYLKTACWTILANGCDFVTIDLAVFTVILSFPDDSGR